ncbi:MAG: DNA-directed RNA polymerase subunit omega [Nitrospinota bacterium]
MGYEELKSRALEKISNRFLLVKMLSKRIRQLDKGADPLIETNESTDSMEIALREIIEDKVRIAEIKKEDEITEDTDKEKKGAKKKE